MNKHQKLCNLYEKTRQDKNLCGSCNKPKQMYYNPWCPRCETPKVNKLEVINLLQVLYHLEATGHSGIKDKIWHIFCDWGSIRNDSYFKHRIDKEEPSKHLKILDEYLKTVTKNDTILFEVSW